MTSEAEMTSYIRATYWYVFFRVSIYSHLVEMNKSLPLCNKYICEELKEITFVNIVRVNEPQMRKILTHFANSLTKISGA